MVQIRAGASSLKLVSLAAASTPLKRYLPDAVHIGPPAVLRRPSARHLSTSALRDFPLVLSVEFCLASPAAPRTEGTVRPTHTCSVPLLRVQKRLPNKASRHLRVLRPQMQLSKSNPELTKKLKGSGRARISDNSCDVCNCRRWHHAHHLGQ